MNRTLIADDHAMFREGLRTLLEDTGFKIIGEAEDGVRALALIERERPELAILDVGLPKMDGIHVVRSVVSQKLPTKCIMLTMHDEPEVARSAMEAGAGGYILKYHTFEELRAAVDAVMSGGRFTSPRIAMHDAGMPGQRERMLTLREREVLSFIAQGKANKEIAGILAISIRTVEAHRSRIMRKLDIHSHAGLIHYALREHGSSMG